jgi:hypothetical protein
MSIKFYPSASKTVVLPMASDPVISETYSAEAIAKYLQTSNPEALTTEKPLPPDITFITLKPLTYAELAEARRQAGPAPVLGQRILEQLEPLKKDEKAQAAFWAALSKEEKMALAEHEDWLHLYRCALVLASIKGVSGWDGLRTPEDFTNAMDQIRPVDVRASFILEASLHVQHISTLSPEGKA